MVISPLVREGILQRELVVQMLFKKDDSTLPRFPKNFNRFTVIPEEFYVFCS